MLYSPHADDCERLRKVANGCGQFSSVGRSLLAQWRVQAPTSLGLPSRLPLVERGQRAQGTTGGRTNFEFTAGLPDSLRARLAFLSGTPSHWADRQSKSRPAYGTLQRSQACCVKKTFILLQFFSVSMQIPLQNPLVFSLQWIHLKLSIRVCTSWTKMETTWACCPSNARMERELTRHWLERTMGANEGQHPLQHTPQSFADGLHFQLGLLYYAHGGGRAAPK